MGLMRKEEVWKTDQIHDFIIFKYFFKKEQQNIQYNKGESRQIARY